jgi:polyisoprenyl-phosphate glycosyltransferase
VPRQRLDNGLRPHAAEPVSVVRDPPSLLSVVAPVFNEEGGVEELVSRILASSASLGAAMEIVIVNDGSTDHTLARLVALSECTPALRVIDLTRNFGHMAALTAGLSQAQGDVVVVLDGDLQDPPELIPDLVREWRAGADVVYALRIRRGESIWFRQATRIFYWLLRSGTRLPIPQQAGTFGLLDRRIANTVNSLPERARFFSGLRAWVGGRQASVAYHRQARRHGRSRVGVLGLISLAAVALTSFSRMPLRLASALSMLGGVVLFLVGLTAIAIRAFTPLGVPGWATYTTLIGFMGFIQSIVLAVIAEYVGIIFEEVKSRPIYLIRGEYRQGSALSHASMVAPRG